MQRIEIEHQGCVLWLHASGAIIWPEQATLLVADLHLGKENVFQQSGIAIPHRASSQCISRLAQLIEEHGCKRVVVLGDLLHAKAGLTTSVREPLEGLVRAHAQVSWVLVAGNHDRHADRCLESLGWTVMQPPVWESRWGWVHDPVERDKSPKEVADPGDAGTGKPTHFMAGHLHPSVAIRLGHRDTVRVPCFWIQPELIVLPAFGGWTGTHAIRPGTEDRVIGCIEGRLLEISPQILAHPVRRKQGSGYHGPDGASMERP